MPSYYVTYGGNRLTYPGVSGPIDWYHEPGYHETLLWSGSTGQGTINLSGDPSAYDVLRIVPGGANQAANSLAFNPLEVSYKTLSATNNIIFENTFYGTTGVSGVNVGFWFGGILTGCSGTAWTFTQGWGRRWNVSAKNERYDFGLLEQIWGIKYA